MSKSKPKVGTEEHAELKYKEAIQVLNDIVNVRIGPSEIDGVGIFALKDIKKGTKLQLDAIPHMFDLPFDHFDKLNPEVQEILLGHFPQIVNGSHFMYPVTKFTAYLNHSDNPNYDAKEDKTLRKIKAGEEITEDYRKIEGYEKIYSWLK